MTFHHKRRSSFVLRLECLEGRDAPATLVSSTRLTYQDADGDNVSVVFSKPILTAANVNNIFTFDAGTVDGSNTSKQQLQTINLTGEPAVTGSTVAVTAVRSPANGGDGLAHVGEVIATGADLDTVTIDGDLGRIIAGDGVAAISALKGLTAHSLGRYGTSTGAADLHTLILGKLAFLKVKSDVKEAFVDVQGALGLVTVGGSLIGGASDNSGRIFSNGDMGFVTIVGNLTGAGGGFSGEVLSNAKLAGVKIGGSVQGGTGDSSGRIFSNGNMGFVTLVGNLAGAGGDRSGAVRTGAKLAGVKIGGSVRGGAGAFSGQIVSNGDMGFVTIVGNLTGAGGVRSGEVSTSAKLAGVKIGGSVQGGASTSGLIFSNGNMGFVTILGNLAGAGDFSGVVRTNATLAGVKIGGSVQGGAGNASGWINSNGNMGFVTIGGDLVGGSASGAANLSQSGFIQAKRIASLTLGGSLIAGTDTTSGTFANNGAIRVDDDLGTVLIKGSVIGNNTNPAIISARGKAVPTATADAAIGSLRVLGRVELAQILAGVDFNGVAKNADAQIGTVFVGGDWIASSIAAGAMSGNGFFGDTGDAKMSGGGVKNEAVLSKIASLTIKGQALGTVGGTDHFGIVAENIGIVKIGGTTFPTTAGISNDDFFIGITGDFKVKEI